jgi:hypothetical protein
MCTNCCSPQCYFKSVNQFSRENSLQNFRSIIRAISLSIFYHFSFLRDSNIKNPGWIELFLTVMILYRAINFVKIEPNEAAKKSFIFPESIFITRISSDLFPEEVASPLPWFKRNYVTVCLTNEKFRLAKSLKAYDLKGKRRV